MFGDLGLYGGFGVWGFSAYALGFRVGFGVWGPQCGCSGF